LDRLSVDRVSGGFGIGCTGGWVVWDVGVVRRVGLTPAARIAAAIDLLEVIEGAPKRPADAVANDFFRSRRYIGSGDRRAVSDRVWAVLRGRRRIGWWLGEAPQSARLLIAASLLLEGWAKSGVQQAFSGGQFAAPPLDRAEVGALSKIE